MYIRSGVREETQNSCIVRRTTNSKFENNCIDPKDGNFTSRTRYTRGNWRRKACSPRYFSIRCRRSMACRLCDVRARCALSEVVNWIKITASECSTLQWGIRDKLQSAVCRMPSVVIGCAHRNAQWMRDAVIQFRLNAKCLCHLLFGRFWYLPVDTFYVPQRTQTVRQECTEWATKKCSSHSINSRQAVTRIQ